MQRHTARLYLGIALSGLAVLICGCAPETTPYSLAPASRYTPYEPCCYGDPDPEECARFPFPSIGRPVKLPECDPNCDDQLTLPDLIDIALYNSTQTQDSWAAARVAAAEYGESRQYYYPDVDFAFVASDEQDANPFGTGIALSNRATQWYPRFNLSWLLLDMGTRKARTQVFREAMISANFSHNREIQTVIQTVMVDYFDFEAQRGLVAASEADLADAEVNLQASLTKYMAGVADLSDVAQARTVVAQRELDLLNNLENLEKALGQLTADLGIPSTEPLCVEGLPKQIELAQLRESVDCLLARAYNIRPDLWAAWANLRSKKASIDEAVADLLPTMTLNAHIGRTYFTQGQTDNLDYLAQVSINLPIFQGFNRWNKIKQAKAELEKAKAELRQLEISISQEIVVNYKTFRLAGEKIIAGEDYVDSASESYAAVLARYKAGTVDFVTLANAFAELADARAALVLARQDFYTSLTDLAYATGGLEAPELPTTWRTRICP